ncbi:MAG: hypothetical protein DRJ03_27155 [Chloroflexi bacterium]|nr:MAG: hypothetical protein DRJ03_27155 [Chloroflexota bacterium]
MHELTISEAGYKITIGLCDAGEDILVDIFNRRGAHCQEDFKDLESALAFLKGNGYLSDKYLEFVSSN